MTRTTSTKGTMMMFKRFERAGRTSSQLITREEKKRQGIHSEHSVDLSPTQIPLSLSDRIPLQDSRARTSIFFLLLPRVEERTKSKKNGERNLASQLGCLIKRERNLIFNSVGRHCSLFPFRQDVCPADFVKRSAFECQ